MPSVSPGRPPPPSVKKTIGRCKRLGELEQAVLLAVVLHALRARQHGVVVGHGDATGALGAEQVAVDRADAADEAVGRRVGDEIGEVTPAALSGDHERAVLDERPVVDEVGDVLPRRAPASLAAPSDGVGAGLVEAGDVPLDRLGEVGADTARGGVLRRVVRGVHVRCVDDRFEHGEPVAGHDRGPHGDEHLDHDGRARSRRRRGASSSTR